MSTPISDATRQLAASGESFRGTVLVIATWETARPGLVMERFPALKAAVDSEPGCLCFEISRSLDTNPRSPDNTDIFTIVERYTSLAAFDEHRNSDHFERLLQRQIAPLLVRREIIVHQL